MSSENNEKLIKKQPRQKSTLDEKYTEEDAIVKRNEVQSRKMFLGHPVALCILFFTEMWERFSYYGMRANLVLCLKTPKTDEHPGLGLTEQQALTIYGIFGLFVYLTSVPGGYIADRWLGQKKCVFIGALLMCVSHYIMYIPADAWFFIGLILMTISNGFMKPNISIMIGQLYEPGDQRKETGFFIFYMGINLGAFIASLVAGVLADEYGFHFAFLMMGVVMTVGFLVYVAGQPLLKGLGEFLKKSTLGSERASYSAKLTNEEKDRLKVLGIVYAVTIIFWMAFEQAGGALTIYADEKTNRIISGWEFPSQWFQSVNPFFIITLTVPLAIFWKWASKKKLPSTSLFKIGIACILNGIGFFFMGFAVIQYNHQGQSSMFWLVACYLFNTLGELCISPVLLCFISKLAPIQLASFMMGLQMAASGVGNLLASLIGKSAENWGEEAVFFGLFAFCSVIGIAVLLGRNKLQAMTHGADDNDEFFEVDVIEEKSESQNIEMRRSNEIETRN